MARSTYLGTANDLIWGSAGPGASPRVPSKDVTLTFWDAQTGGTQHTDLLVDGAPVTEVVIAAADLPGTPAIQGPDGVNDGMWVQAQIAGTSTTDRREFILPWPSAGGGGGAVASVNGQTGAVALSASDVGADPSGTAQGLVDSLKGAAPAAYDTLVEIASKLDADDDVTATILADLADKVDAADLDAQAAAVAADPTSDLRAAIDEASVDRALALTEGPAALGNNLTKYGVVIDLGASGSFDDWRVESLTPAFDPQSGRLAGVYTGYTQAPATRGTLGLAWSDDGVTWTKAGQLLPQSGVAGAPDENGCTGGTLHYVDGTWHLYYIGLTATGYESGTKTICRATAPSIAGPWTRHGAAISPGGGGWYNTAVYHRSIVRDGGTYYMFFNAAGTDSVERIGYATASSIAGPWTVNPTALISPPAGWVIAGDPSVTRVRDGWRMDFFQYDGANYAADYYATTTEEAFPVGWAVQNGGNPILKPSEGYDGLFAHKPAIMRLGGRVFHYYTAVTTGAQRRTVALATEPPIRANMKDAGDAYGINTSAWLSSYVDSLGVFGYPGAVPPGVLVKDTFSDESFGTADTGQTWTVVNGTVTQERGILHAASLGGDNATVTLNPGQTGVTIDADFKAALPTAYQSVAIILRAVDSANYWEIRVDESAKTTWIIWTAGNIASVPANIVGAWSPGDHITVEDDGTNITVYRNGVQVGTVSDTTHAAGQGVGLRWGSQLATEVDNFTVTPTPLPAGAGSGVVQAIVAGSGIAVDSTDPANPIISATGTGGGGGGGLVDFAQASRTAGDVTIAAGSWANVDTGLDMVLTASAGDVIEVEVNANVRASSTAGYCVLDFVSVVGGSPVNSWTTGGAPTTGVSHPTWSNAGISSGSPKQLFSGRKRYTLKAGDVSGGAVTVRLRAVCGASMVVGGTADGGVYVQATNLGPQL